MSDKLWVVDGNFRVGPCDKESAVKWCLFIIQKGGTPTTEAYPNPEEL